MGLSWICWLWCQCRLCSSLTEIPGKQNFEATNILSDNLLPQGTAAILGLELGQRLVEWVVDREMERHQG
jgi:hypothetical protein